MNNPQERTTEVLFRYVGTVAGLANRLDTGTTSLIVELDRQAHKLGAMLRELWPTSVWQLIHDHDA